MARRARITRVNVNARAVAVLACVFMAACAAPVADARAPESEGSPRAPSAPNVTTPLELVVDREGPVKRVTLAADGAIAFDGAVRARVRGARIEGSGGEVELTPDGRVIVRRKMDQGPLVLRFTPEDDLVPESGGAGIHLDEAGKVWNTDRASYPASDGHFVTVPAGSRRTAAVLVVALMVFTPAPLEHGAQ